MDKIKEIEQFEQAINNLRNTKYILVDKRVNELVKVINKNTDIYNYIVECGINFDFNRTLLECESEDGFKVPERDHILVAFVYELLKRFESKKYNITDFLEKNFSNNFDNIDSFDYFCIAMINRFEASIIKALKGNTKEHKEEVLSISDLNLFKRIGFLIDSLRNSDISNNLFDEKTTYNFLTGEVILIQKGEYESALLMLCVLKKIKFKNKLNKQLVKEILEISKIK